MFNAMTNAEVVLSIGRVLREAATVEGTPDEYGRSQLLSAYSVARHLAAEEAAAPGLHAWFREAVAAELDQVGGREERGVSDLDERATAMRGAGDSARMGEVVADTLAELRTVPEEAERCARLRALLGELADREVAALAAPPR